MDKPAKWKKKKIKKKNYVDVLGLNEDLIPNNRSSEIVLKLFEREILEYMSRTHTK